MIGFEIFNNVEQGRYLLIDIVNFIIMGMRR